MVNPRKLIKAAGEAKPSFPNGAVARKGHFAAYTRDGRRFAIPIAYLNSSVFKELLRRSEEEFGPPAAANRITLPCDAAYMEHLVASLGDASSASSALKRPCASPAYFSCLIDRSHVTPPSSYFVASKGCEMILEAMISVKVRRWRYHRVRLGPIANWKANLQARTNSGPPSSTGVPASNMAGFVVVLLLSFSAFLVDAEDPYRYFNWDVTFGDIYPLGIRQQGILINGQFPGPDIYAQTNDNIIINVFNSLTEPFLITWQCRNGVQQRANSWEDGVSGTNCPIPPGKNFTYVMHFKDQIGSFFYAPSLAFHKAAGGFGGIRIRSRPGIPVPFGTPDDDFTVLIGDWYKANHTDLKARLDRGKQLPFPDAILINGRSSSSGESFTVDQGLVHLKQLIFLHAVDDDMPCVVTGNTAGKTYRLRISNVGLQTSLNIRVQGHKMKLVEVEGTHTVQNEYSSLDVHVGQSLSVLLVADQPAQDYYIAVSTRFTQRVLTATAILHYSNSNQKPTGPIPGGPTDEIDWSLMQARTILTNLTASGPRPNPQGSYHYGSINVTRTIRLANSAAQVDGKQRYAVNSVSFVEADTPLKLADYFEIGGVFRLGSIADEPTGGKAYLDTSVMAADFRTFVEIVFENKESIVQSWHLDGYNFWVVGMDGGKWGPASRKGYNLNDAVSRCTTQVYPKSWTAVYIALDNVGMWNMRSEFWARRYLGQQFYLRVYTPVKSERDEHRIPSNALLCGRAANATDALL
ncbi:L-ascorbate oxidase [Canna indica]|uniref:L-ascorbate oxidase n=1 Tax=Canna indica TaxID=4628 RepID=A0AAQ3KCI3_9LILI|nr:L-ascorbate oxidase [Canna indica]